MIFFHANSFLFLMILPSKHKLLINNITTHAVFTLLFVPCYIIICAQFFYPPKEGFPRMEKYFKGKERPCQRESRKTRAQFLFFVVVEKNQKL